MVRQSDAIRFRFCIDPPTIDASVNQGLMIGLTFVYAFFACRDWFRAVNSHLSSIVCVAILLRRGEKRWQTSAHIYSPS